MNLDFYNQIKNSSAHTQSRLDNANFVIQNISLLPELIEYSFNVADKQHIRATAILDKIFELQIELSVNYLDLIIDNLHKLKNDSAIRAISRILIAITQLNSKKIKTNSGFLTENQLEKITEACFDLFIADYRVAVKHNSLLTLFEIGKEINWIYPELQNLLEKQVDFPSPGYKSIVKKILILI